MMHFYRLALIVAVLIATALPAHAAPVFGAIGAVFTAIKGSFVLSALVRVVASVALSRLAASLAPKPKQPGIKTDGTASGSQNPASFIFGYYATDGVAVCAPMSHGTVGKTPNAYLTYVIEVSDVPGAALLALIINGERCTLGPTPHAEYGLPVTGGTYAGNAWVKYSNGTQTVADSMLVAKYGSYAQRPWTSAMVGRGLCYAIVTFNYNRQVYSAFPAVRFEMQGIPLYDPRKDSTVGGTGAHRLNNSATWQITNNPVIMTYNAHLGIILPGGHIWGGGMPAADLPLSSVFAAANACDALVDNGTGGTEPRFRAGLEVFVSDEPAGVCEELLTACLGQVADVGGQWRFQAGDPALPIFFFSDDDIFVSLDREKQPFPGLDATHNGISANYPDPAMQWEPNNAPPIYNSVWEAKDGNRRLVVNKDFAAVPYPAQVQRNMRALIADDRRFLTHGLPFPPEATVLEPLDTAAWTSDSNGYSTKTFEIGKTTEDLRSGVVQVTLRERDPSDSAVVPGYYAPVGAPSAVPVVPPVMAVPSFVAVGISLLDTGGVARRPAVLMTWNGADLPGVTGIEFEIRLAASGVVVKRKSIRDVVSGVLPESDGIIANTAYQARARLIAPAVNTDWTVWTSATTPVINGIALVGGTLQSTDFVTGVAGWTIGEGGNAEFNNLVARGWIKSGAVSDELQAVALGPYFMPQVGIGFVFFNLLMPVINPGTIWRLGVHFFGRRWGGEATPFIVQLQQRYVSLVQPLTAWATKNSWTIEPNYEWDQYTLSAGLSGQYSYFEYRLICTSYPNGQANVHVFQDAYLTLSRITK